MSNYTSRQNLLKLLAKNHPDIRHEEALTGGALRKSFFKSEADLTASNINGGRYTGASAVFKSFSGRLVDLNDSIRIRNQNEWLFVDKIRISNTSPSLTETLDDVYDRMLKIVLEMVQLLIADYDDNGGCGWFKMLLPGSINWEKEGPIGDMFYGWRLSFQDDVKMNQAVVSGDELLPIVNYAEDMAEIIAFSNVSILVVPYTALRRAKYGPLPDIEVWLNLTEDGEAKTVKGNVEIQMDAPAPNQTQYVVLLGGTASGFVRLGK